MEDGRGGAILYKLASEVSQKNLARFTLETLSALLARGLLQDSIGITSDYAKTCWCVLELIMALQDFVKVLQEYVRTRENY